MAVIQDPTGAVLSIWQAKSNIGVGITGVPGTLCWADLSTADPARAGAFYAELFQWHLELSENDSFGYLHILNQGEYIGGVPPVKHRSPNTPPHWLSYFTVEDVDPLMNDVISAVMQVKPTDVDLSGVNYTVVKSGSLRSIRFQFIRQ